MNKSFFCCQFPEFKGKYLSIVLGLRIRYWTRPAVICCLLLMQVTGLSQEVRKAIPVERPGANDLGRKRASAARGSQPQEIPSAVAAETNAGGVGGSAGLSEAESPAGSKDFSAPNTMKALNDKRKIGIRDKLSLNILEDERPPRVMTVTDSGEVEVPYIGRVEVQNRTCKQLAFYLKGLLEREYYYQATVLIGLDSAGGQVLSKGRYYVVGQVARPGPHEIPMDEKLTISKAIIRAGDFTQYANKKTVRLVRKNPVTGQLERYEIDLIEILEKGRTERDIEILPGDTITVKEKFFNF